MADKERQTNATEIHQFTQFVFEPERQKIIYDLSSKRDDQIILRACSYRIYFVYTELNN